MSGDSTQLPFAEIGRIVREHGLKGELKIEFNFESTRYLDSITMVYLRNQRGDFYPCRISDYRVEGKGNKISFFVQFDHIADRSSASALKNRAVFIDHTLYDELFDEQVEEETLIDFEVVDENDEHIGLVTDIMDSGLQEVISVATTQGLLLIPMVETFVDSVDEESKTIHAKSLDILRDI